LNASTSEIQTGQDANIKVNGALITRSTNTISDAITGVTLNLNRAKAGTPVTVTVSRDTSSIKTKIKTFVDDYNSSLSFISNQFRFDEDTQSAGPLTGDPTLLSIQSQVRAQVSAAVSGLTSSRNSLAVIGIAHDKDGTLKIDDATLDNAINNYFTNVRDIFIANGTPSVTDLEFVSVSDKTKAGTYTVNITAAAQQASVTSFAAIPTLTNAHTLTITDTAGNISATVNLSSGDTIDTIVNTINSELASKKTQQRTSSGTGSLSASATLDAATGSGGLGAVNGEIITVSGRTKDGTQVSGTLTVTAGTTTVQNLLNKIEDVYNGAVTASISGGKIVVTDTQSGASLMDISVTSTGSAGGNLGSFSLTTTGRSVIEITASKDGSNKLVLTHNAYGATPSKLSVVVSDFTTQQISFGSATGTSASATGVDVAGTIGGETATGSGRILTGNSGNSNTDGLAIRVTSTSTGSIGTIKTTIGTGEQIKRTLKTFTDSLSGLIASREKGLQNTINDLDDRMKMMQGRVEMKRQRLSAQFTNLEKIVGSFNSLGSFLSTQLAKL
jgi:flagellar hook-associated protein 2